MNDQKIPDCAVGAIPKHLIGSLDVCHSNDPLVLHIRRLSTLYPSVVRFRDEDIDNMDDSTKRLLIKDMHDVLGITSNYP